MDTSSDESFTWGKTSNVSEDSTDSSTNYVQKKNKEMQGEIEIKNINGNCLDSSSCDKKSKKRKIKKETLNDEDSVSSLRKKRIKLEPSSDNDVKKKKSKKKIKEDFHDSTAEYSQENDEGFLNEKVKEELESSDKLKAKKKKKRSHNDSNEYINSTTIIDYEFIGDECIEKKSKKKKKQADLEKDSFTSHEQNPDDSSKKRKQRRIKEVDTDESHNNYNEDRHDRTALEDEPTQPVNSLEVDNGIRVNDSDKNFKNNNDSSSYNCSKLSNKYLENGIDDDNKNIKNNSVISQQHRNSKPKILERIRFEEDVDSDIESSNNKEGFSSQIRNFLKANSLFQPISENSENMLDITKNDEIWILKCPHEIDVINFSNKDFALDSKCKIKINGETYCGTLENESSRINIMSNENSQFKIRNVEFNGIISFRKRLPKPHFVEDNVMVNNQTGFIPLPETKCRHPLFGSDYKNAIKVPSSISQRLKGDIASTENCERKKRKKHKKECYKDIEEQSIIMKQPKAEIVEEVPVKKTKKRKHIDNDDECGIKKAKRIKKEIDSSEVWESENDDERGIKKAKRIKKEIDSSEVWESEKAIEENLFNF